MNLAVLFNSDHPQYLGIYGWDIRDKILGSGVLQKSNRHMKISVGDVLIMLQAQTKSEIIYLCEKAYFEHPWQMLDKDKLRDTFLKSTVHAWVIQNIDEITAKQLDQILKSDDAYLGCHAVEFSYPIHLVLYRNQMAPTYRIKGKSCNLFYSMSLEDETNEIDTKEIMNLGFEEAQWEDIGAHHTIFDNFDTVEHFEIVLAFKNTISPFLDGGNDEADELAMLLEDLSPKLFNTLGAAIKALTRSTNEEDFAQVGLSGRRYIEQLADVLFPPSNKLFKGKKVDGPAFKNRIWAYIDISISDQDPNKKENLSILGKEIDRLVKEINALLHADQEERRMIEMFRDLSKYSVLLLRINPKKARQPYYAFEKTILEFYRGDNT